MSKPRLKKRLSTKCLEKNLDTIVDVARKEGIEIDPFSVSTRQTIFECPYKGCSRDFGSAKQLLNHLVTHKGKATSSMDCPFCSKRMSSNLMLLGHLENSHPELDVDNELKELRESIDPVHRTIRDSIGKDSSKRRSVADRVEQTLGESIFAASSNAMPFDEFRISLRSKLFESIRNNIRLVFKFLARSTALEWSCLICSDAKGLSWKNPISLRIHALLHLEEHEREEHFGDLKGIVGKEWALLKQAIPSLPLEKLRVEGEFPVERSFLSYCLLREDDAVGAMMDAIDESTVDGPPKKLRSAFCLVCHSSFAVSLLQPLSTPPHFMVDSHRYLKAKGWSEFHEVAEIAELPHEEGAVNQSLCFSALQHLTNEPGATPHKLLKWRCTLCSLDVAIFPSSISLRFFALRHLEREHPSALSDGFYRHEWELLQLETSLCSMRLHSQQKTLQMEEGRPIDITDASDFLFRWSRPLRVPPPLLTCGHCFFVSREDEMREHIVTHGYCRESESRSRGRIVKEEGSNAAMIDERTMRMIRKSLHVPRYLLPNAADENPAAGDDDADGDGDLGLVKEEEEQVCHQTPQLTTPTKQKMRVSWNLRAPTPSKYRLRARSVVSVYSKQLEEESRDEETMSSEESDSGHEKNYQTQSYDEDEEDTVDETMDEEDEYEPSSSKRMSIGGRRSEMERRNNNTCTESSIASNDIFDNGLQPSTSSAAQSGEEKKRGVTRVHENAFKWEGPEPAPLTAEQIEIVRLFKESGRCELCPSGKGYRGLGKMNNVEQSMMAHLIVNHGLEKDAKRIIERKKFLLAASLSSGSVDVAVPPFMMEIKHVHFLTCSRCCEFKCGKQSNLVIHWESCSGVKGGRWRTTNRPEERRKSDEEKGVEEEVERRRSGITPRRSMNSVRCPMCREGWRKSVHYSDDVSVAIHLLLKHTTDQEAYQMACQIEEETSMATSFPFISIRDSFVFRVKEEHSGVQCARCDTNSTTLSSAIRHATRYHATLKEKEESNAEIGAVPCPLPSSSHKLRSILGGMRRSAAAVRFIHCILKHGREEKEAREHLEAITEEEKAQLREEPNLRLDVDKSVELWLSGGRCGHLVCSLCGTGFSCVFRLTRHFGLGCGTENDLPRDKNGRRALSVGKLTTPKTEAEPEVRVKRGRGKTPSSGMECAYCDRIVYASDCYAPSISMDIHVLKMHPREAEKDGVLKTLSSVFPFIDFSRSTADSLQCSHCEYTAKESRYILPHAWTKHALESQQSEGVGAWAAFEMEQKKKREKQRIGHRKKKEGEDEIMRGVKRGMEEDKSFLSKFPRLEEEEGEMADTSIASSVMRTPRQRSTVSRWLDKSQASMYSYSGGRGGGGNEGDLKGRLDRLFGLDSPSTSSSQLLQQQMQPPPSSSIFHELPEAQLSRMAPQGRAEDISHIEGIEGVRCSVCSFKGRNTESLRIHFNEAHQEVASISAPDVFPCAVCSLVFNSKKKWRCHAEEDHTKDQRPFQCFKCHFRYETHQKLRAHQIRVHESEILVHPDDRTCRKCSRLFGSLRAYKAHMERHEKREMEEDEEEEE